PYETTTDIGVRSQAQCLDLLARLQTEQRRAMVMIAHDRGGVAETAERVQVQYAGQKVEEQPVKALFRDPHHPYTAALLSALPERAQVGQHLPSIAGVVPGQHDRPRGCLFAPRCGYATVECDRGVVRQGPELGLALCNYPLKDGKPLGHPGVMPKQSAGDFV
ncbi:dipeptide ABC transporter ATP-binding protein DppD, partial [Rhizobium sp. SEMIA 4085]|uniref:oligopeptide/dipeptide ABC transporter ATP-binding protein n=1 Tax=Rhizobium sp. SEMIA 4085 TaxID=2137761 RepID=UPI0017A846EA|nr:dipeptide ABC transporter ATP-binding protein DppD [Rhizobium sp. SEMIA 4085]